MSPVFTVFLNFQKEELQQKMPESLEKAFTNIVGVLKDSGKTLEEYREERIREQYGVTHWYQYYFGLGFWQKG